MMIATALLTKILHHKLAILVMPIQNMWEYAQMAHQLVLTDNGQQNVGMKFSLIIPINVVIQLTIIAMEVLMKIANVIQASLALLEPQQEFADKLAARMENGMKNMIM